MTGYRFEYDDEIRDVVKQFGTQEGAVDRAEVLDYLRAHSEEIELRDEVSELQDKLVQYGLDQLADHSDDQNG